MIPDRWQPASSREHPPVDGRLARPLGRQHAGGGHHRISPTRLRSADRARICTSWSASRGDADTVHLPNSRCDDPSTWAHSWSGGDSDDEDRRPDLRVRLPRRAIYGMPNNLSGARAEEADEKPEEGGRNEASSLCWRACSSRVAVARVGAHHSFAAEFDINAGQAARHRDRDGVDQSAFLDSYRRQGSGRHSDQLDD